MPALRAALGWLAAASALSLGACHCDPCCDDSGHPPPVDGGPGPTGGGGGGGGATVTLHQYRLTAEATVLAGGCFSSPPMDPALPSQTFDVLVWDYPDGGQYVALTQMPVYRLGDSPPIAPPEAVKSELNGAWDWQRFETRPVAGDGGVATEHRQTSLSLVFASAGGQTVSGTLALQTTYACSGPCLDPNPSPDTRSCSVTLAVQGTELSRDAGWTTPAQPIAGAARYLFAGQTFATPPDAGCLRPGAAATATFTQELHGAWLDLWQVFEDGGVTWLRPQLTRFQLGDAPVLALDADLPYLDGGFGAFSSVTTPYPGAPNATETRQTQWSVQARRPLPALSEVTVTLGSHYECTGSCPSPNPAPDSASCGVTLEAVIARVK